MKENFSQVLREATVTDEKGIVLVSKELWEIILQKLEYGEVIADFVDTTAGKIPVEVEIGLRKILRGE